MPCATLLLAMAACSAAADAAPLPDLPADVLAAQTQGVLLIDLERLDVTALQQAIAVGCHNWMYPEIERELDRLPEYRRRLLDAGVRVISLAALVEMSGKRPRMDRRLAVLCDPTKKDAALREVGECLAAYAPAAEKTRDGERAADPAEALTGSARWHGSWLCLAVSPWGERRIPAKPGNERTQRLQSSLREVGPSAISVAMVLDREILAGEAGSDPPEKPAREAYRVFLTSSIVVRPKLGKRPELSFDLTTATDREATLLEEHFPANDGKLSALAGMSFMYACYGVTGILLIPDFTNSTCVRDGQTFHVSATVRELLPFAIGANERPSPRPTLTRIWEIKQAEHHYRLTWKNLPSRHDRTKVEDLTLGISQRIAPWPHELNDIRYDPDSDELLLIAGKGTDTATQRLVHKYGVLWTAAESGEPLERFRVAGKLSEFRSPPAKPRSGHRPPRREGGEFGEWPIE